MGAAALASGCIAPTDIEGESPDEAELTGESSQAVCALLDGYLAGEPSSDFPDMEDPVVGYKLLHTVLQTNEWGMYFDYRIQFCNGSSSYTEVYYRYVFGVLAGQWAEPPPGLEPQ